MSKRKLNVLNEIRKPGGAYVVLGANQCCHDIGYVSSIPKLNSHIAAYAAQHHVDKVKVMTGRNVMNVDGPSANFSVTVKIQ